MTAFEYASRDEAIERSMTRHGRSAVNISSWATGALGEQWRGDRPSGATKRLGQTIAVREVTAQPSSARPGEVARAKPVCEPKEVSRFRNEKNDANVIAYDLTCTGKINANYVIPDKTAEAIVLTLDRNGDGRPDVMFFDLQRRGKWDLSFWDEDFKGYWTLVGYHPDGGIQPSTVESYENYRKRLASR